MLSTVLPNKNGRQNDHDHQMIYKTAYDIKHFSNFNTLVNWREKNDTKNRI